MAKLIVLIVLWVSSNSYANVIYSFDGLCTVGCTGHSTINMSFKDSTISNDSILSFVYSDSVGSINMAGQLYRINAALQLPDFQMDEPLFFDRYVWNFLTRADGTWSAFWEDSAHLQFINGQLVEVDHNVSGNNGVWLLNGLPLGTVPEPPMWALMLVGLVFMGRKK